MCANSYTDIDMLHVTDERPYQQTFKECPHSKPNP